MPGAEPEFARSGRDTDADWRELGQNQPYWGVISHPDFRSENLTPALLESADARCTVGEIIAALADVFGRFRGETLT